MSECVSTCARIRNVALLSAVLVSGSVSQTQAQPVLDRVVGHTIWGPVTITKLTGQTLNPLVEAVRVPMGLETISPVDDHGWKVNATGMTLRGALDAIVAADPRYEWREDNGVVVIRPVAAWANARHLLYTPVAGLKRNIHSADPIALLGHMFGLREPVANGPGDTKMFSVDLPAGDASSVPNDIVRAHGG